MKKHKKTVRKVTSYMLFSASVIILLGCSSLSFAQQSLGDLIREGDFEWLVGKWTSVLDQDRKAELTYEWEITNHLIIVDFKFEDYRYHEMIYLSPGELKVVEVGVDSRGGCAKGTWQPDGMDAVSTTARTDTEGNTERVTMVHTKVDDKTMRLALYRIDDNGNRTEHPWAIMEYKRQKPETKEDKKEKPQKERQQV